MSKKNHTYQENFEIGVEYTYDDNYKKVYNVKKLKRKIKSIINSYKPNKYE